MVKGILADANIVGHVQRLVTLLQGEPWREFWEHLNLVCTTFVEVGLDRKTSDAVIWQFCQEHDLVLITSNRNKTKPDSLEATIRDRNTSQSLPVLTLGDADRVLQSRDYADRVVEGLLDILFRIDSLRGTGRLYLP